ncbi:MAG TPA: PKD domain-containing protein, partial [Chitinophagaceae bacterium]|nr:PKD domain-containing protein [Chitinophagaceae bacterium]
MRSVFTSASSLHGGYLPPPFTQQKRKKKFQLFIQLHQTKMKDLIQALPRFSRQETNVFSRCMTFLICILGLLFTNKTFAQTCPDLNCTSSDVQIVKVYLADANGVELDPCTVPSNVTAYLWVSVSTNTPRQGVMISGTLQIDGTADQAVSFCSSAPLTGSSNPLQGPAVNWTCGKAIRLTNIFTAWGTGNTDFCNGSPAPVACGEIVSSKCRRYEEAIIVEAPLVASFSTGASCITGNGVQTITFTSTTAGGKLPYKSIEWDFTNDGTYDATGASASYTYPAAGNYTAAIRVTDANNTVNVQTGPVAVGTCCIPSTAPASAGTDKTDFCPGTAATLTVSGGSLGTGASWKWYTGSCGGVLAGSGSSLDVSPAVTTTYYVRAEGDCGTTDCAQVTVDVKTWSTAPASINRSANNFCPGGATTLTVSGGSLGSGASWKWYMGSCSGNSIGT